MTVPGYQHAGSWNPSPNPQRTRAHSLAPTSFSACAHAQNSPIGAELWGFSLPGAGTSGRVPLAAITIFPGRESGRLCVGKDAAGSLWQLPGFSAPQRHCTYLLQLLSLALLTQERWKGLIFLPKCGAQFLWPLGGSSVPCRLWEDLRPRPSCLKKEAAAVFSKMGLSVAPARG